MTLRYEIFVLLTCLLVIFLGYGTFATARLLRTWQPDRNLLLMPAENVARILMIPLCIGLGLMSGLSVEQLGWRAQQGLLQSVAGLLWGLAIAGFFIYLTRWLANRAYRRFYSTTMLRAMVPRSRREFLLVSLAMIPVVLVEELLFRSLLIGGFTPLIAIPTLLLCTGILFGIMHSPQGAWGMVGAGLAGVLFGLLFFWFESLLAPSVAHYVANMVQIGVAMQMQKA